MKKKFLLAIIPALLVLSACQAGPRVEAKEVFKEDALLHDELFGGKPLQVRKAGVIDDNPVAGSGFTITPKIGVQYSELYDEGAHYAIRVVAAIGDTANLTATWNRSIMLPDGSEKENFTLNNDVVITTAYEKIKNGTDNYTPATGEGEGYNRYVVYTLYDIPANQDFTGYYLFANLTLSRPEQGDVVSKTAITEIKRQDARTASLAADKPYFIKGVIGGIANRIVPLDGALEEGSLDHAKRNGLSFLANDVFGAYKITNTGFSFLNKYDTYYLEQDDVVVAANYSKVRAGGTYDLFVNGSDQFGLYAEKIIAEVFLNVGVWETDGNERYAIYAFKDDSHYHWYNMESTSTPNQFKCGSYDFIAYPNLIFCRMNGNKNVNAWNNVEPDNVWNQTGNITFSYDASSVLDVMGNNVFSITGWHENNDDSKPSTWGRP